jgi:hypothetical protein
LLFPDAGVGGLVGAEIGEGGADVAFVEVAGVLALGEVVLQEVAVDDFAEAVEPQYSPLM